MAVSRAGGRFMTIIFVMTGVLQFDCFARAQIEQETGTTRVQYACDALRSFAFCDITLPLDARLDDLISRLTLQEKIQHLTNSAIGISRLGVPPYQWWQEASHGVAKSLGISFQGTVLAATSFPQPILTAASFNSSLFHSIGQAISTEARAMHNLGQSGLTFWAPNVNIFRDPRWGRGQETPGEDPTLSSSYALNFVQGMQEGVDAMVTTRDFKLKTSACCKHFTAYDLDNWNGVSRYTFDAQVSKQDLADTFNVPFKSCIQEGRVSSIMCSYNAVNGVPMCASNEYLTETVRNNWGFDGYVVTDCDSLKVMYSSKWAKDPEEAVSGAILAGVHLNCGDVLLKYSMSALNHSNLKEGDIDVALRHTFKVLMRLGFFDGTSTANKSVYAGLGAADVCSPDNQDLALEAAAQGIVLLKNNDNTLPLSRKSISTLAVIGPNANDAVNAMIGNYEGIPCVYITPVQGLVKYVNQIVYQPGCADVGCLSGDSTDSAALAASNADAVVLVVGLDQSQEAETLDRSSLLLPGLQQQLVEAIVSASTGPVVLVIMSGGPVDISFAKSNPLIHSILWVGYPGQAGGQAIADIIFGDRSPGGKLPMTWYPESYTQWPMTDMNMRPNTSTGYPGRTHRFHTGQTVYNFGFGLTYTNFQRRFTSAPSNLTIPSSHQQTCFQNRKSLNNVLKCSSHDLNACESQSILVKVAVKNDGPRAGTDVVLLFAVHPRRGVGGIPLKQLVGFYRVHVDGYAEEEIEFKLNPCEHHNTFNLDGSSAVDPGLYKLVIGEEEDANAHHYHSILFLPC